MRTRAAPLTARFGQRETHSPQGRASRPRCIRRCEERWCTCSPTAARADLKLLAERRERDLDQGSDVRPRTRRGALASSIAALEHLAGILGFDPVGRSTRRRTHISHGATTAFSARAKLLLGAALPAALWLAYLGVLFRHDLYPDS